MRRSLFVPLAILVLLLSACQGPEAEVSPASGPVPSDTAWQESPAQPSAPPRQAKMTRLRPNLRTVTQLRSKRSRLCFWIVGTFIMAAQRTAPYFSRTTWLL